MPKGQFQAAFFALFTLQVKARHYAAAFSTLEALRKNKADPALLKILEPVIADLKKLQQDDRSYAVDAQIGARSSWHYKLFKKSFHVDVQEGRVNEIKLRCKKKYVFFPFQADIQYHVAAQYGACDMEVVGQEGTKFKLTQSS